MIRDQRQPVMRARSAGQTRERTLVVPVVSCDSIGAWASLNSKITGNKHRRTNNDDRMWQLNQGALSSQRNKSFNDAFVATHQQRFATPPESEQQPPNVIVFFNRAVNRKHRRSSNCSQITMDDAINYMQREDEEGDDSNASLDVHDVFADAKRCDTGDDEDDDDDDDSNTSSASSNGSFLGLHKPNQAVAKKRIVPVRQISLRAKAQRRGSLKSTNSAKQRWMQNSDHETSSDDDSQASESDYEDFAQDSFTLVRRVESLQVIENDANHMSSLSKQDSKSSFQYQSHSMTLSKNVKSVYGRAA